MGTTGLETAFAALYTELVLAGVLELGLLVERMTAGARAVRAAAPRDRVGRAGEPDARRPRRRVGRGRARLGEPLGELLLCRPATARPRAADARRRRDRPPRARARGGGAPDEPARARARGAARRRRAGGLPPLRRLRGASRSAARSSCRRRASSSCPRSSASSTRRASATPRPRSACRTSRGSRRPCSPPRAPRASTSPAREQALVCGIETHVCVSQTVHDLLAEGIEVHVPADAVGSRHELDYERGLERMERAGAVVRPSRRRCSSCSSARARPSSRPSRS